MLLSRSLDLVDVFSQRSFLLTLLPFLSPPHPTPLFSSTLLLCLRSAVSHPLFASYAHYNKDDQSGSHRVFSSINHQGCLPHFMYVFTQLQSSVSGMVYSAVFRFSYNTVVCISVLLLVRLSSNPLLSQLCPLVCWWIFLVDHTLLAIGNHAAKNIQFLEPTQHL